ncbi:zf-HC2 domain-containing protein [Halalkalibacter akibai]|uniref:Zinc-finger domain-containing protein n=1 Tax=Halalkalibacter akibai (strain ATCC 43226 / DSM 21942 / CIP 109018 / JCM 9157 / 1139) TaxID=1236973 RepID=W4QSP2_HALA3|nr:zf-HC2 domain-containing protein [Halalkalibacter akibai]GAE35150.1 hypothetical protein JCM9157_2245 [Halalkalibacter akibai JCM 9157]
MNKKDECSIYQSLYELYVDEEVEEETVKWMKNHEKTCENCRGTEEKNMEVIRNTEDYQKIKSIKIVTFIMYGFFLALSIWMSIWYLW